MFSKKTLTIVGLIVLLAASIMVLSLPVRPTEASRHSNGIGMTVLGPFQKALTGSIRFVQSVWSHYFNLVAAARENEKLRKALSLAIEEKNQYQEVALSNERYRRLLELKTSLPHQMLVAEVIGKDPSPWFKTIIIDKGSNNGVAAAMPVVISEGIVGQVVEAAGGYAKVLLLVDQNSAVDALVQRTRARGIVKGGLSGKCTLDYVLRKDEIGLGDIVISSGVDGVFPKGLRVGEVSEIVKRNAGTFLDVTITPYVDFEKIEEVLVIVNYSRKDK
ncbi:MAG: rod shape-determining protein MreC [Pseudomonadota bacterium]